MKIKLQTLMFMISIYAIALLFSVKTTYIDKPEKASYAGFLQFKNTHIMIQR